MLLLRMSDRVTIKVFSLSAPPPSLGLLPSFTSRFPCRQSCSCQVIPESECIIFHLHGGEHASTKKENMRNLNRWALDLGTPIFDVQYSIPHEAPFPRAAEEVLFSYCWMRNNFKALGNYL